jgi:hypothetical protein
VQPQRGPVQGVVEVVRLLDDESDAGRELAGYVYDPVLLDATHHVLHGLQAVPEECIYPLTRRYFDRLAASKDTGGGVLKAWAYWRPMPESVRGLSRGAERPKETFVVIEQGPGLRGDERSRDVLSPLAQLRRRFTVGPLPEARGPDGGEFDDALRDNTRTPVPDQVQFRLDFPGWRGSLGGRDREMVGRMALGHSTGQLARRFRVSAARVSQKRREFRDGWARFCGEAAEPASA